MDGIRAVVKKYETETTEFEDWIYHCNNHDGIYSQMMIITDGDHEISANAASWCELATIGEIYEFREGEIEIMEID